MFGFFLFFDILKFNTPVAQHRAEATSLNLVQVSVQIRSGVQKWLSGVMAATTGLRPVVQ